jgi:hypothetical protein
MHVSRKVAKFRAIFTKSEHSVEVHDTQIFQHQAKVRKYGFCCWISEYLDEVGWDDILGGLVDDGDWVVEGELECGGEGEGEDFEMWATDYSIEKCNVIEYFNIDPGFAEACAKLSESLEALDPGLMTESIKGWSEELQKDLLSKLNRVKSLSMLSRGGL